MSTQLNSILKYLLSNSNRQLQSHQSALHFGAGGVLYVCESVCAGSSIDLANVLWSAMPVQLQRSLSSDLI